MFRDELRDKVWNEIRQSDLRAFAGQLTPQVFAEAAERSGNRIGTSALNLANLVWLGIAGAMTRAGNFAFVLTTTLKLLQDQQGFGQTTVGREKKKAPRKQGTKRGRRSKHDPRRDDPTDVSEEAFAQARQRMPLAFWTALLAILAERFQRDHGKHANYRGFRLLAIDGTTLNLSRHEPLRAHYGKPQNGRRKQAAPQARLVMLTLPGTRIPLAYEVAPLADAELTLAERLLPRLRARDLLLMDRGFISYSWFWQLQLRGAYFGTRLKKDMKLKRLRSLGPKDALVEWAPAKFRSQTEFLPSIRLRVIDYQFPGFRPSAIVTNVLDPSRLSREDWVRMAHDCDDNGKWTPGLYHRRWEIETTYFELKEVLHVESLRSRTPASLEYELAGKVLYYLLVRWLIVQASEEHGLDPLRISFTNAVRELELMRAALVTGSPAWVRNTLLPRLLDRVAAHTVPLRPGRHYPRPNDTQPKDRGRGQRQLSAKIHSRVNTKHNNAQRKTRRQA